MLPLLTAVKVYFQRFKQKAALIAQLIKAQLQRPQPF